MRYTDTRRLRSGLPLFALCLSLAASGVLAQNCKTDDETGAASRFTDNSNGTMTDTATGLTWKRCSEGQTWDGSDCSGKAANYSWREAVELADAASYAGKDDWRLADIKELTSLVDKTCSRPALDLAVFPATPAGAFWSSTSDGNNDDYAWNIHFIDGHAAKGHKYRGVHVRLVRGGP